MSYPSISSSLQPLRPPLCCLHTPSVYLQSSRDRHKILLSRYKLLISLIMNQYVPVCVCLCGVTGRCEGPVNWHLVHSGIQAREQRGRREIFQQEETKMKDVKGTKRLLETAMCSTSDTQKSCIQKTYNLQIPKRLLYESLCPSSSYRSLYSDILPCTPARI